VGYRSAKDNEGKTTLEHAVKNGPEQIVEFFKAPKGKPEKN